MLLNFKPVQRLKQEGKKDLVFVLSQQLALQRAARVWSNSNKQALYHFKSEF